MPRELFQSPALARSFAKSSAMSPSLAIRKKRRSDPFVPPWCKLTAKAVWQGRGSILFEHAVDMYCMEKLEVTDHNQWRARPAKA